MESSCQQEALLRAADGKAIGANFKFCLLCLYSDAQIYLRSKFKGKIMSGIVTA